MAADQNPAGGDALYPALEPYRRDWLDAGAGHRVYFEESGNPQGFPVLFIHGGPGSQSRPAHRRFFDPAFFRIILFDQRGCGQSSPRGSLADNTTAHLIADMEALRRRLGIERWLMFGGSWGSTLAIGYAIGHAHRVAGMILRGVFLGSRAEVDWFLSGVRHFVPEAWAGFAADAGTQVAEHYCRLIHDPEPEIAMAAARRWNDYESRVMEPASAPAAPAAATAQDLVASVKVQLHYLANDFFLRPGELLDNLWRVTNLPVIIVQGRLDMVCPPVTAFAVAKAFAQPELCMVPNGGHSALQPQIAAELCAAARRMQTRMRR